MKFKKNILCHNFPMLLTRVEFLLAGNQDASKLSKRAVLQSVLPAEFNSIFAVHCEYILAQSQQLRHVNNVLVSLLQTLHRYLSPWYRKTLPNFMYSFSTLKKTGCKYFGPISQQKFTYLESSIETPENCVKYAHIHSRASKMARWCQQIWA